MKIYLIELEKYQENTFNSHVVVANDKEEVRDIAFNKEKNTNGFCYGSTLYEQSLRRWCRAKIETIGEYTGRETNPHIILSSFNPSCLCEN